jgi:hypothetical protein
MSNRLLNACPGQNQLPDSATKQEDTESSGKVNAKNTGPVTRLFGRRKPLGGRSKRSKIVCLLASWATCLGEKQPFEW